MKKKTENNYLKIDEKQFIKLFNKGFENVVIPYTDGKFKELDTRIDELNKKINRLPDKDFVIEHMGKLKGDFVIIVRKEDEKVNLLINILKRKNILTRTDLKEILGIKVFPKLTVRS